MNTGLLTLERFACWTGKLSLLVSFTFSKMSAVSAFLSIISTREWILTLRLQSLVVPPIVVAIVHHASIDIQLRIYDACLVPMSSAKVFDGIFDILLRRSKREERNERQELHTGWSISFGNLTWSRERWPGLGLLSTVSSQHPIIGLRGLQKTVLAR